MSEENALVVFQGKKIRRIWHNEEWWFSVVDIIGILSESEYPRNYWKVLKHRLTEEGANEAVTNCNQLKLPAEDGLVAGVARKELEKRSGQKVISRENYLKEAENKKKRLLK